MKKIFGAAIAGVLAMFCTFGAQAAEYSASEYEGAAVLDGLVCVSADEASVVYEWYNAKRGVYSLNFQDITNVGCTVCLCVNERDKINISDLEKTHEIGLDTGINSVSLCVEKNNSGAKFSVGKLSAEYVREIDDNSLVLEFNEPLSADAEIIYYENYGSDMNKNDVTLYRRFNRTARAGFMIYAPYGGEYSAELVISDLGRSYTSDINMSVNGVDYPLTPGTVTKLADLANASDRGLMKKFRMKNTVTLREGMNSIVLTAIEPRDNDNLYLFFADHIRFTPAETIVTAATDVSGSGVYRYDVCTNTKTRYYAEVALEYDEKIMNDIADIAVSTDGASYIPFSKGSVPESFADASAEVISEYTEKGVTYGVYRLKMPIEAGSSLYLRVGDDVNTVERLRLIPADIAPYSLDAKASKAVLLPGDTADISVFVRGENGNSIDTEFMRERGMVVFSVSDRDVIAVNADGRITALSCGTAEVTVSASDGATTRVCTVPINVYNESYGMTVLSAKKDGDDIKIKLLAPFVNKTDTHIMTVAGYDGQRLVSVSSYEVGGMEDGQIIVYKAPAAGELSKIISLSGYDSLKPVADIVTVQ